MPGRFGQSENYRYGFNGKEIDDDMRGGTGVTYDYGFRIYDSRIARFLSVDPLTKDYPWYTPYQFAGNKPIWAIDLDGLEELLTNNGTGNLLIIPENKIHFDTKKLIKENPEYDIMFARTLKEAYQGILDNGLEPQNIVHSTHGNNDRLRLNGDLYVRNIDIDEYIDGDESHPNHYNELQALIDIAGMVQDGGTFSFRACLLAQPTEKGKKNPENIIWKISKLMLAKNPNITLYANADKSYLDIDSKTKASFNLDEKQTRWGSYHWGWVTFKTNSDGEVKS